MNSENQSLRILLVRLGIGLLIVLGIGMLLFKRLNPIAEVKVITSPTPTTTTEASILTPEAPTEHPQLPNIATVETSNNAANPPEQRTFDTHNKSSQSQQTPNTFTKTERSQSTITKSEITSSTYSSASANTNGDGASATASAQNGSATATTTSW